MRTVGSRRNWNYSDQLELRVMVLARDTDNTASKGEIIKP